MVDLIDEIKEDLHRERLGNLWVEYGKWVVVLAVVIILATAGKVWWVDRIHGQQEALGKQYYQAIDILRQDKSAEAQPLFASIEKADNSGYPVLASFKRAAMLLEEGKTDDALAVYKTVAANQKIDAALRDLAALLAVNLEITYHKADNKTVETELAKLSRPESAWRFSAKELEALHAMDQGNKTLALELYTSLSQDYMAPHHLKQRATEMVKNLTTSGSK